MQASSFIVFWVVSRYCANIGHVSSVVVGVSWKQAGGCFADDNRSEEKIMPKGDASGMEISVFGRGYAVSILDL